MSKSNAWETALLQLFFNNTNGPANLGDSTGLRGSSTAGSLYVSLHTADPGEGGSQNTSEATYGSYARQAVARSSAGWTVSGNTVSNAATVTFPQASSGSETITYFGIGTSSGTGAGTLLYSGAVGTSLAVATLITPSFGVGALTVTED